MLTSRSKVTPAVLRQTAPRILTQAALRVLLAAILAPAVVLLGVAGMLVTHAPRWVSLLVEPFSFLLAPGALFAWAEATHNEFDFSSTTVIKVSLLFYFFLFTILLLARLKRAAATPSV